MPSGRTNTERLTRLTKGVSDVEETANYYAEFGLIPSDPIDGDTTRRFSTVDGGAQLILVHRPIREPQIASGKLRTSSHRGETRTARPRRVIGHGPASSEAGRR